MGCRSERKDGGEEARLVSDNARSMETSRCVPNSLCNSGHFVNDLFQKVYTSSRLGDSRDIGSTMQ